MEPTTAVLAPPYACPEHRAELELTESIAACRHGHDFAVEDGVPRFVQSGYAEAFGRQWRRFRLTQLDSYSGLPMSEERLRRCFDWSPDADGRHAEGKTILEAGCGA